MNVQAAGRRSATGTKQPRTSTPHWRKRRRQTTRRATATQHALDGSSGAVVLATPASVVSSAVARVGARFAALASLPALTRRLDSVGTPVEPVPASWTMVGLMTPAAPAVGPVIGAPAAADPVPLNEAVAREPAHVPVQAAAGAATAVAAPRAAVTRKTGSAQPHSIKNGPPKASRKRRSAEAPIVPVALPDDAGPVTAAIAPVPDASALEAAPVELAVAPAAPSETAPAVPVMPLAVATDFPQAPDKRRMIDPGHDVGVERARSTMAQRIGDDAERLAAIRLEALGWRILARNLRICRAEIDLLAVDPADPPTLVVVEVRHRSRRDFGLAEETVDYRKRAALRRAAGELSARSVLPDGRRLPGLPVRIDLIAIDRGPDGRPALRHHRGIET